MGGSKEKIEVIAYSGYRGEETPRTILHQGKRVEVIEILGRWIGERSDNRDRKRFYRIKGNDEVLHIIY
jgi:hypothetical protein